MCFDSKVAIAEKIKDCVSLPPNPPPILLTFTFIELNFCFKTFATICWVSEGCCVEEYNK